MQDSLAEKQFNSSPIKIIFRAFLRLLYHQRINHFIRPTIFRKNTVYGAEKEHFIWTCCKVLIIGYPDQAAN